MSNYPIRFDLFCAMGSREEILTLNPVLLVQIVPFVTHSARQINLLPEQLPISALS